MSTKEWQIMDLKLALQVFDIHDNPFWAWYQGVWGEWVCSLKVHLSNPLKVGGFWGIFFSTIFDECGPKIFYLEG